VRIRSSKLFEKRLELRLVQHNYIVKVGKKVQCGPWALRAAYSVLGVCVCELNLSFYLKKRYFVSTSRKALFLHLNDCFHLSTSKDFFSPSNWGLLAGSQNSTHHPLPSFQPWRSRSRGGSYSKIQRPVGEGGSSRRNEMLRKKNPPDVTGLGEQWLGCSFLAFFRNFPQIFTEVPKFSSLAPSASA